VRRESFLAHPLNQAAGGFGFRGQRKSWPPQRRLRRKRHDLRIHLLEQAVQEHDEEQEHGVRSHAKEDDGAVGELSGGDVWAVAAGSPVTEKVGKRNSP
jgi:hypothetical protein